VDVKASVKVGTLGVIMLFESFSSDEIKQENIAYLRPSSNQSIFSCAKNDTRLMTGLK
jgi:hypothetical protein